MVKISEGWTTEKLHRQHATILVEKNRREVWETVLPTCWWTAKNLQAKQPCFRGTCNPMCRSNFRSEESIFPTFWWNNYVRNRQFLIHAHPNILPAMVIMNSSHQSVELSMRFCTAPSFCNPCCKPEKNSKKHQTHKSLSSEGCGPRGALGKYCSQTPAFQAALYTIFSHTLEPESGVSWSYSIELGLTWTSSQRFAGRPIRVRASTSKNSLHPTVSHSMV